MWIIVMGTLIDGYRFVGPFGSSEEAINWAHDFPIETDTAAILDLLSPEAMIRKAHEFTRRNMQ